MCYYFYVYDTNKAIFLFPPIDKLTSNWLAPGWLGLDWQTRMSTWRCLRRRNLNMFTLDYPNERSAPKLKKHISCLAAARCQTAEHSCARPQYEQSKPCALGMHESTSRGDRSRPVARVSPSCKVQQRSSAASNENQQQSVVSGWDLASPLFMRANARVHAVKAATMPFPAAT